MDGKRIMGKPGRLSGWFARTALALAFGLIFGVIVGPDGGGLTAVAASEAGAPAGSPGAPGERLEGSHGLVTPDLRGGITPEEWRLWQEAFVTREGRVVDAYSDEITHSEGQGYGMMLAHSAGDVAGFELIWYFTRAEMLLRDDGLIAWKWDPAAEPRIADINNATDGDMLVAYALLLAGRDWGREDLTEAGRALLRAVRDVGLLEHRAQRLILPGVEGFGAADLVDGPVINPSYWIFEVFPLFERVDPAGGWDRVAGAGLDLVRRAGFGPHGLPTDWLSMAAHPRPSEAFDPVFGYNTLRVPLYLVRGGWRDTEVLEAMRQGLEQAGPDVLALVDLETLEIYERLADPGYRAIAAMISCAIAEIPFPPDLRQFEPTSYYPSALHLLALAYLRKEQRTCL